MNQKIFKRAIFFLNERLLFTRNIAGSRCIKFNTNLLHASVTKDFILFRFELKIN